jgi:hypothetical protein
MDINFIDQKHSLTTSLLLCSMCEIRQVPIYLIKLVIQYGHDYAVCTVSRARIFKRLWSPGIDFKE